MIKTPVKAEKNYSIFFNLSEKSAFFRRVILLSFLIVIWSFTAFSAHPLIGINQTNWFFQLFDPASNRLLFLLQKSFSAMFSADVLFFILTIILSWYLSLETIAFKLAGWWGFKKPEHFRDFMKAITFGKINLPKILVEHGEYNVKRNQAWLYKTGGPAEFFIAPGNGVIIQHNSSLEVAFNPIRAESTLKGVLQPFQKIKSTFELQHLFLQIDCNGITKDGVPLRYEKGILKIVWKEGGEHFDLLTSAIQFFRAGTPVPFPTFIRAICTDLIIMHLSTVLSEAIEDKNYYSHVSIDEIKSVFRTSFLRKLQIKNIPRHNLYSFNKFYKTTRRSFLRIPTTQFPMVYPKVTFYLQNNVPTSFFSSKQDIFHDEIITKLNSVHPLAQLLIFTWERQGTISLQKQISGD